VVQVSHWMRREGDSLELMNKLTPDSVVGVVTDPPYCSGARPPSGRRRRRRST
jgi:hypothetical protein